MKSYLKTCVASFFFFLDFCWLAGFVLFRTSLSLLISLSSVWELGELVDIVGVWLAAGGVSMRRMDWLGGSSSYVVVGGGISVVVLPSASVGGSAPSGVTVLAGVMVPVVDALSTTSVSPDGASATS